MILCNVSCTIQTNPESGAKKITLDSLTKITPNGSLVRGIPPKMPKTMHLLLYKVGCYQL